MEETNDFLIIDDDILIDSQTTMTVFGNLNAEVDSRIINNGEFNFSTSDEFKEIYNNSSDTVFAGKGDYVFKGKRNHYLTGNYNNVFYNLSLEKNIGSALVTEIPEIQVLNKLQLNQGILDVQENIVRIENADSNAIDTKFLNIYSFINGRLIRKVRENNTYHFPISSSKIIRPIILTNHFPEVNYIDVAFNEGANVDLSAEFGTQYGIALFNHLDNTGTWKIAADKAKPQGYMNLEAYIANFRGYPGYEDNMFGLMQTDEIEPEAQDWAIAGDLEYFDSPYRKVGTLTSKVNKTEEFGYYAVGVAERQKFVNLIAPGGGRETRFIIQGLNIKNPDESQYDNQNCELVLYNIYGAEVWRKKPYENDLDLKDFMDGTYYYEFSFTINGRPGAMQSYIDVKRTN